MSKEVGDRLSIVGATNCLCQNHRYVNSLHRYTSSSTGQYKYQTLYQGYHAFINTSFQDFSMTIEAFTTTLSEPPVVEYNENSRN